MAGLMLLGMLPACRQQGNAQSPPETPAAVQAAQADSGSRWVSYDARTNTLTFKLEAGAPGGNGPFNFDSYANGAATLVVPPKSTVVMNFVNDDATPHSAEVIPDADPMPNMGGDPAIPGAFTNDLTQGLPQGGTDVMRFTAPPSGSFRIFCGVPGHGLSGMWIRFRVDPAATTAKLVAGT
jgi:sulfocyanin SoxE-like protein